jgi:hypothetical protein
VPSVLTFVSKAALVTSTAPCGTVTVPFLDQPDDDVVRDPLAEVVSSEVKVVARVHDLQLHHAPPQRRLLQRRLHRHPCRQRRPLRTAASRRRKRAPTACDTRRPTVLDRRASSGKTGSLWAATTCSMSSQMVASVGGVPILLAREQVDDISFISPDEEVLPLPGPCVPDEHS